MLRISTKLGWTSTVQPRSKSHRKTSIIRWRLRWSQEKCGAGVPVVRELKPSGSSSTSRKGSYASRSSSKKARQSVPKSLSCGGLRIADSRFEKLCDSSGISFPLKQCARSRTIGWTSLVSPFLNWSLCLASVEERLAPRSRVCGCLDSLRPAIKSESDLLDAHSSSRCCFRRYHRHLYP